MATGDVLKIGGSGDQEFGPSSIGVVTLTTVSFVDIDGTTTVLGGLNAAVVPGWLVSGFGIPDGATVVSIVPDTSFVISAAATETASISMRVTEPAPGAIGAGAIWSRQELPDLNVGLSIRNSADDGWIALGPSYYDSNGWLMGQVASENGGLVVRAFPRNLATDLWQIRLEPTGVTLDAASAQLLWENAPTADPSIAGALWIDTAAARVVKVSAG